MSQPACDVPFEKGAQLCKVCRLSPEIVGIRRCSRLIVESPAMKVLMQKAAPIANTDASVMILGESGTGKEMLARALHANSPRRGKPFVAINVAAIPSELLESELFGHVRGAFTGAVAAKRGLFEAADGGTLLLDEIGEMPIALQAKLLRVLQDGEVRRVGDTQPFSVDVRIFCATHRNLAERVETGHFREDLYYRLKVFTLSVPPLRERQEDVAPLAAAFLEQERHPTRRFTPEAKRLLETYSWPGNIRELQNAVKHGSVLSQGRDVAPEHLPDELREPWRARVPAAVDGNKGNPLRSLAEVEREHVLRVLEAVGGHQVDAARILGIGRNTLWRKLKTYGP